MTTPDLPGQLGRRPTDPDRYARTIKLPLTGTTPPHPLVADHLSKVPRWMLGGNDRWGTCGPVSIANFCVLTWKYLLGEDITVSDEAVFDLYRRSGNPNFDPATGADDNGVDVTVMLSALVKGGIQITHHDGTLETVVPLCFAAHPVDVDTVRAVTSIFGGSLLAVDLDVVQQTQTGAGQWDYVAGSGNWGGHAIPGGSYTSSAVAHTTDETVVTWQQKVGTTDTFIRAQLTEAYVVVFPALWAHPSFQAGVDQVALAAAYTSATGRPFPIPVPPPPPPPPPPDVHVDVSDRQLNAAIPHGWLTTSHSGPTAQVAHAITAWKHAKGL